METKENESVTKRKGKNKKWERVEKKVMENKENGNVMKKDREEKKQIRMQI
jgi:hypothetical protein